MVHRVHFDGVDIVDRRAVVPELLICQVHERVNDRWLSWAGQNKTGAAVLQQLSTDSGEPLLRRLRESFCRADPPGYQESHQRPCERLDLWTAQREPMVGVRSGRRQRLERLTPFISIAVVTLRKAKSRCQPYLPGHCLEESASSDPITSALRGGTSFDQSATQTGSSTALSRLPARTVHRPEASRRS